METNGELTIRISTKKDESMTIEILLQFHAKYPLNFINKIIYKEKSIVTKENWSAYFKDKDFNESTFSNYLGLNRIIAAACVPVVFEIDEYFDVEQKLKEFKELNSNLIRLLNERD